VFVAVRKMTAGCRGSEVRRRGVERHRERGRVGALHAIVRNAPESLEREVGQDRRRGCDQIADVRAIRDRCVVLIQLSLRREA
jgi:hypothetical protein